jgi:phosphatidylserine/phosphatidylglycerophosphate/cardiolipin synthase-like enzyme
VGSEELRGDKDFDLKVEKVLTDAGVEVHYYRLLAGKVMGRLLGRTHNKIVVVDGRIGYTGGFGIWKVWEGDGLKEDQWRDTHVRVEGPEVRRMQLSFSRHWQESGGGLLPPSAFPEVEEQEAGTSCAGFVDSAGKLGVTDAERMVRARAAVDCQRVLHSAQRDSGAAGGEAPAGRGDSHPGPGPRPRRARHPRLAALHLRATAGRGRAHLRVPAVDDAREDPPRG